MIIKIKTNKSRLAGGLSILAAALLASWVLSGCASPAPARTDDGHEEHGHEEHGEGEEESGADLKMGLDEIRGAMCEHDTRSFQCAECRYEVGVVRIAPELTEAGDGSSALVRFERVSSSPATSFLETTGEAGLAEDRTVRVSSPIAGVVSVVRADLGAEISPGEVLFEVRSAEVAEILGEYRRASELAALAGKNYRRDQGLHEKGITSEEETINSKMAYREQGAALESAREKLSALGLTPDELARGDRGEAGALTVRSAQDGVVVARDAAANETVAPGQELMTVSDLSTLWVWSDLYERDLGRLPAKPDNSTVEIVCDAFPGRTFSGRLDHVGAVMDEGSRTVKARIVVSNPEGLLRAGMFCQVRIPIVSDGKAILVPKEAVLSDEGEEFVFKHLEDEYWVRRPVVTGREFDSRVEVLEGLVDGETIVTEGAFLLKSDVLRSKMGAGCAD